MMLWEVEIRPLGTDRERNRVAEEYNLLTHAKNGAALVSATARGYLLEGDLNRPEAERLLAELLVDSLAESGTISELATIEQEGMRRAGRVNVPVAELRSLRTPLAPSSNSPGKVTVLLKPGVMDPVALSVVDAAHDL